MYMPWQLIPQTVYDLIGRILPASVVLLLVFVVARLPSVQELPNIVAQINQGATAVTVTLAVIATYTAGVVLGQMYAFTFGKLLASRDRRIENRCRQECISEHELTLTALDQKPRHINVAQLPRTFVMHDHLRLLSPNETSRLLKVRAERRMAEVITLGAILSLFANTILVPISFSTYRFVLEVVLLVIAVGAWRAGVRRLKNFTNGTTIMWLMHATQGPFEIPRMHQSNAE